jgi:hypothetical protein
MVIWHHSVRWYITRYEIVRCDVYSTLMLGSRIEVLM